MGCSCSTVKRNVSNTNSVKQPIRKPIISRQSMAQRGNQVVRRIVQR